MKRLIWFFALLLLLGAAVAVSAPSTGIGAASFVVEKTLHATLTLADCSPVTTVHATTGAAFRTIYLPLSAPVGTVCSVLMHGDYSTVITPGVGNGVYTKLGAVGATYVLFDGAPPTVTGTFVSLLRLPDVAGDEIWTVMTEFGAVP